MNSKFIPISQTPPCKYFGKCGGCAIQNIANHKDYKFHFFKDAITELSYQSLHEIVQIPSKSRRRTNFRIKDNKIGFNQAKSNNVVAIDNCLLLEASINDLISPLNHLLRKISCRIDSLSVTNSDSGVEIVFHSNTREDLNDTIILSDFSNKYNIARIAWQIRANTPYSIIEKRAIQIKFEDIAVNLPINCFLQVSKESNQIMSDIITSHLSNKPILELFCGVGSFTIAMQKIAKVTAFEGSDQAIATLAKTAAQNKLAIEAKVLDLYQTPLTTDKINKFSQVVINPPRNGATPQIKQIAEATSLEKVILVSCSVENFIRDAKILINKDFCLTDIYPIDQFIYSNHLEIVAVFSYMPHAQYKRNS